MKNTIITLGIIISISNNICAMHGKPAAKPEKEEKLVTIEEAWRQGKDDGKNRLEQLKKCQEEKNKDKDHLCDKCEGFDVSKKLVEIEEDLQWWKDREPGKDTASDKSKDSDSDKVEN